MIEWVELFVHQAWGMRIILLAGIIGTGYMMWKLTNDQTNTFDIKDLVCVDGRVDERKFERFGAWVVSTWGFVFLILENRFSEWFFTGYMGVWVTSALISKYLDMSASKSTQSSQTTQTTQTSETKTN